MKAMLILLMRTARCATEAAQSFIAVGAQYKNGGFKLYDVPDAKSEDAQSVGAFIEGAYDFKAGAAIVAPRGLFAVGRNFPEHGVNVTEYDLRPEVELRLPLAGGIQPFVATGLNYYKVHDGADQLNPLVGVGVQFHEVRGSFYRVFPDSDRGDARGYLYRFDYTKKLSPFGLRLSGEVFTGRSDLKKVSYEGHIITFRAALVK